MLRFHLDEHVSHAIARALQRRGIDVTTTTDAGLLGAADDEQLAFALSEQRGIAYCPPDSHSIGHMVRCLCLMNDCLEPHEMFGKVEFL